jgi:hypothetical protein
VTILGIIAVIASAIAALLGAERLGRRSGRLEERARQADARATLAREMAETERIIVGETRDAEDEARRLAEGRAVEPITRDRVRELLDRVRRRGGP